MRTEIALAVLPIAGLIVGYILGRCYEHFEWMSGVGDDEYEI